MAGYWPDENKTVRVTIRTVDPRTRQVHAALKDGAVISLAVWETPAFFRWPHEDEDWTAVYESGFWRLGWYIGETDTAVTDLQPGEGRIDADKLYITGETFSQGQAVVLTNDARLTNSRVPTGAAGGVLAGTYPNPTFAVDMATQTELDTAIASVESGSNQALEDHAALTTTAHGGIVASTDPRLTNARTPTGDAGGVLAGTYPNPSFAQDMATQGELDASNATIAAHTALTTTAHGGIVADTDSRLTNSRTPSGPAGGVLSGTFPDPGFAVDMATQVELNSHTDLTTTAHGGIIADTDPRLTNSRTPTGVAGGVLSGTYPDPSFAVDMATQAELNAHTNDTANPHGVTKAQVGLGNADNTSDANKPISTAQQAALNLKAPLASPAFTGTITIDTDTNLYRGGVASLYTDATSFRFTVANSRLTFMGAANRYNIDNAGDSFRIFRENTDGTDGAVRLSITDAGAVNIPGALSVGGDLSVTGMLAVPTGAIGARIGASRAKASQVDFLQFYNATDGQDWAIYRPANTRDLVFWGQEFGGNVLSLQSNGTVSFPGPNIFHTGSGVFYAAASGIRTTNSAGNLHLDGQNSGGTNGYIYANWYGGLGQIWGNGAGVQAAIMDASGNFTTAGVITGRSGVIAKRVGASMGSAGLIGGTDTYSGYVEWATPNGTRQAYMGFNTNNTGVQLVMEQGIFTVFGGQRISSYLQIGDGVSSGGRLRNGDTDTLDAVTHNNANWAFFRARRFTAMDSDGYWGSYGQMMQGYDTWLRLNSGLSFTMGLYIPGRGVDITGDLRVNNSIQIGGAGSGGAGTTIIDSTRTLQNINTPSKIAFSFSNGWRGYGGGAGEWAGQGYWKDAFGMVHLEGLLDKAGGNWVANEVILNLPAGYRPTSTRMFQVPVSPTALSRIDIRADGNVVLVAGGASNPVAYLSLDGITFRAYQ